MTVIITLAKLESDQVCVSADGLDLGRRPVMKTVARPVAMVWSLSGDDADVAKAKTFAAANGYTVLTFPTTEQDPIGRAKHQITDRRVLVCGGRDYADAARVAEVLSGLSIAVLIHGAAKGADTLAARWAADHAVAVEPYPADWARHSRGAGMVRNRQMLTEGRPDLVVAFPGGKGTANMVALARKAGVEVMIP